MYTKEEMIKKLKEESGMNSGFDYMDASDILDEPEDYDFRVFPDRMIGNDGSCMLVKKGWQNIRSDIALIAVEGNITLAGLTFLLSDITMKKDGEMVPFQFYYNPDMEEQKADLYVFM